MSALVGIVFGSPSDQDVMAPAGVVLEKFGIEYEMEAMSAHRNPERVRSYVMGAEDRGLRVLIAGAGRAAHLPGVVAALTPLPVIGVPIEGPLMGGLDALLAIVQMPSGVPVATVAVNGASNAALLAVQMLATGDDTLRKQLREFKDGLARGLRL
ncbi:MAG: 5-(carboxyamino)imidazole ribonucleotide mutase [Actinomycetota bacterium]|nr:5-(carboxyamino)imidazole ribonucleotide mutase [Actinomycetota bacterium]